MTNKISGFKDLDIAELRRSAVEDFAAEVGPKDNKAMVLAALVEAGVEWSDYVAQHPEYAEEGPVADVITEDTVVAEAQEPVKIVTKEPINVATQDKYLVKMVRDNPLFETYGYRFTQEHPYALVSAHVAEHLLTKEDGFRQATPMELQEYYG